MADPLLLLQAAADTSRAYGEFPVIGARAFIWITAEVHLMFAAFVLGVPMFAVVTEAIGIFGGDERYDRLSKEFTRLLLVARSEEHTSELQSLTNLVCRLLLEK